MQNQKEYKPKVDQITAFEDYQSQKENFTGQGTIALFISALLEMVSVFYQIPLIEKFLSIPFFVFALSFLSTGFVFALKAKTLESEINKIYRLRDVDTLPYMPIFSGINRFKGRKA